MTARNLIGVFLAAALIAGCGGDDEKKTTDAAAAPESPASLGPAYTQPDVSSIDVPDAPGGTSIGASGFDTATEGFAFPNYGASRGPDMRAQELREMFGDGVCIDPSVTPCVLTPAAEQWRQTVNPLLAGGHCYGFAVLSLLMHRGVVKPSEYGAESVQALRIADAQGNVINDDLHADIARSAATQLFDTVKRGDTPYTPKQMIDKLRQVFAGNDKDYVLAVQQPGVGGHAIVPVGLEDQGGGKFDILIYDNNFPYVPGRPEYSDRRIKVDVNADTWEYYLSVRPDVPTARWHGQGTDNRMSLIASALNDTPTPTCPFCPNASAATATTVALGGDPGTTGHLRVTDRQGRVTGWNGEKFVNEIPGAKLRQPLVIQRADVAPEPFIDLPRASGYTIEQVEVPSGATPATLNVTGPTVNAGLSEADEGAKLRLGADGLVAVRGASGSELKLAAPGDREVRVTPTNAAVAVRPVGDDVRITGNPESATAVNPESGETANIQGSGRADLSDLVGTP